MPQHSHAHAIPTAKGRKGPRLPEGKVNVLLMGGGGREHALARRLTQSKRLGDLWTTNPENPGLAALAKPVDVPVNIREVYRLEQFCEHKKIHLAVIGPEEPLADGFADKLRDAGVFVFGPGAEGARLEADKAWAKQLMRSASIPTAEARVFSDSKSALAYLETREQPIVVKASGLAKGKGVFVPDSREQATDAIKKIMDEKLFGDAGKQVVIEERLSGPEASLLAVVDGRNIMVLPACQDHKRLGDGDTGPNTGGMGAFCPTPLLDASTLERCEREILVPVVDALKREGIDYTGVLYAGLMLTPAGPKVLEFNCRFGDPECQPLMARLNSDVLELFLAACTGRLDEIDVAWDTSVACCVVLASQGYPDNPRKGVEIHGVEQAEALPGVYVDHAGTRRDGDSIVTAGGRVLGVTGLGPTLEAARAKAYTACDLIRFEGKQLRRDIGVASIGKSKPRVVAGSGTRPR